MNSISWVGSWSQGLTDISQFKRSFGNETLRLILPMTVGGESLKIRLSNRYGKKAVLIGPVYIGRSAEGSAIIPETNHPVTFQGQTTISLQEGMDIDSDPINMSVPAYSRLTLNLYLPKPTLLTTGGLGQAEFYFSPAGNYTSDLKMPGHAIPSFHLELGQVLTPPIPFVAGIYVNSSIDNGSAGTVVVLGDSITALGWPSLLAERLRAAGFNCLGVMNQAIGGNRILHDGGGIEGPLHGPAGIKRFEKDVLLQPCVKYILVLHGGNDIAQPGFDAPAEEAVSAEEIIDGLREYIKRAHARGIKIIGGTLLPFEASPVWTNELENKRQAVNNWIRTSAAFDHIFDADIATRHPNHLTRLRSTYDSGDHAHPNLKGLWAIAKSVELDLFSK